MQTIVRAMKNAQRSRISCNFFCKNFGIYTFIFGENSLCYKLSKCRGVVMKLLKKTLIYSLPVLVLFAAGCARPPTEELNNAIEAVIQAENDINAVNYAGHILARARDALALMQSEAASKRYDSAKSYAAEAISAAEQAMREGRTVALRIREEAASAISELPPLISETGQGIDSAKDADLSLDFNSVDRSFMEAVQNNNEARLALSNGQYRDAIDLSRDVRLRLNGINQQLSNAAMSAARKK
jgi:hypothetical protein